MQKLSKTTIIDIAKASGVSVSTVSRILNNKPDVAAETRRHVLDIIESFGYTRQAQWEQLAAGRSHIITIHFPRTLEGFNYASMDFITGAAAACEEHNYSLNLITSSLDEKKLLGLYSSMRTDAVLLMETGATDWRVELLRSHQLPFVMIGRCHDNRGISYVDIDFEQAVVAAVEHLIQLGHQHMALLAAAPIGTNDYSPALRSLDSYRSVCARYGITALFRQTTLDTADITTTLQSLLNEQPGMTALIAMDGAASARLPQAVHRLGYAIPQDISVIGTVASEIAEMVTPSLTTINPFGYRIGYEAGVMLIDQLEGRMAEPGQRLMPIQVIERASTRRLSAKS